MKIGVSGQNFPREKRLEEIFELLNQLRVDGIELWHNNTPVKEPGKNEMECLMSDKSIALIKEYSKIYKVKIACLTHSELCDKPEDYAASLSYAVESAAELGATCVNHYLPLSLREFKTADETAKAMMPYMETAIQMAEKLRLPLSLENESADITASSDGMLFLINAVDSPYFKTNYDATNYYHGGDEPFPYPYEILKRHIAYVHLKNGCLFRTGVGYDEIDRSFACSGRLTGEYMYYTSVDMGVVNINAIVTRLDNDGYQGYCTLEPHVRTELFENYLYHDNEYLRSLPQFKQK